MMKDEGWGFQAVEGFWGQTDDWTNISECRVAFATDWKKWLNYQEAGGRRRSQEGAEGVKMILGGFKYHIYVIQIHLDSFWWKIIGLHKIGNMTPIFTSMCNVLRNNHNIELKSLQKQDHFNSQKLKILCFVCYHICLLPKKNIEKLWISQKSLLLINNLKKQAIK